MCPEAQNDQVVRHIVGFGQLESVIRATDRDDTSTDGRKESVI